MRLDPNAVALALVVLIPLLLVGAARWTALPPMRRTAWIVLALGAALAGAAACATAIRAVVMHPPEWDMQSFWVYGRAIVSGQNFYLPSAFTTIGQSQPFSAGFVAEVIHTGFLYPPQAAFLFAPLGLFDLHTATALWMTLHAALLLAAIALVWRAIFPHGQWRELLLVAALMFTLHATIETLQLGQTNFLVLVMLVLFWRARDDPAAGVWLALGTCVKPLFACFGLYLLARRAWRALGVGAAVLVLITLAALLVFGTDVVVTYLRANPSRVAPGWLFTEIGNQSLAATLLRHGLIGPDGRRALIHPLFVLLGGGVVAASAWVAARADRARSALALGAVVTAGLLLYPSSRDHYSELLVLPVLTLWSLRAELGSGRWVSAGLAGAVLALTWVGDGRVTIAATLLCWALCTAGAARLRSRNAPLRAASAPPAAAGA